MANILPPDAEKKMIELSRARYIIVSSTILIIVACIVAGALLPSYLVLHFNPGSIAVPNTITDSEISADKQALIGSQSLLNAFAPSVAVVTPSDAIRVALSLRPQGIHVDHISYTAGKTGTLILQGYADTTDAINAYRTVLLSSKHFTGVDVPVGVLIGSANGRFDVTLSGNF